MELAELGAIQQGDKRSIWNLVLCHSTDGVIASRGPMKLSEAVKVAEDHLWMFGKGRLHCWLEIKLAE